MKFKARQFVLLFVLIGIFVYNRVHRRHVRTTVSLTEVVPAAQSSGSSAIAHTPAWLAFDLAARLRDDGDAVFDPTMQSLQQLMQASKDPADADVRGCVTWLQFYRQGVHHPAADPQWKERSQHHLDGCAKYHRDTAAS